MSSQDEHALIAKICSTLYNETIKNNEKITIEVNIFLLIQEEKIFKNKITGNISTNGTGEHD